MSATVRITKISKKILDQRKQMTGQSIPKLIEIAVISIGYVPQKKLKK